MFGWRNITVGDTYTKALEEISNPNLLPVAAQQQREAQQQEQQAEERARQQAQQEKSVDYAVPPPSLPPMALSPQLPWTPPLL